MKARERERDTHRGAEGEKKKQRINMIERERETKNFVEKRCRLQRGQERERKRGRKAGV